MRSSWSERYMNEWYSSSHFIVTEEISTVPPLVLANCFALFPIIAHYQSWVLAISVYSPSAVLPFSVTFVFADAAICSCNIPFALPSFKARCLGGPLCGDFPGFLQWGRRICDLLMVLTQSLERISIIAFIRVCLGEIFLNLSVLLDSEFTEEWDILYSCKPRALCLEHTRDLNQFC